MDTPSNMSCWLCGFNSAKLTTNSNAPTCENGPCHVCSAVAKVDEEINQAVAALRRLIAKRCDLRSEQNRVHGTLIHQLPVEIKNYIFELLLPSRDEWGESPHKERLVIPSYLSSVCRGWRDVAWSNPSLWSTIHILLGAISSTRISSINDWVLRSRPLPLQIILYDSGGSKKQFTDVLNAISQCSDRWHSLSLKIPWTLNACLPSNLRCQHLKKLRIICRNDFGDQSGPLFLCPVNPEKIEISGAALQSLRVSWNHLTSARVTNFDLEEITQLFQHASHMTHCHIVSRRSITALGSMPPIIHRKLKIFGMSWESYPLRTTDFLSSLTLPSLQEFHTNAMLTLSPTSLPALVQRSSCPLTKLRLFKNFGNEKFLFDNLQPLPGVTDLVLEALTYEPFVIKKLLLNGYFPDLRHLTLRLEPFRVLLKIGFIIPLLALKQSRSDRPNEGKLDKFLVIDKASKFDDLWNSDLGEQLKALNISLMEDGFEIL